MLRILFLKLLILGPLIAEETTDAWIEKLSAAYAKHSGFIATYQSKGEGKFLEATLALDELSGIALIGADATKDGADIVMRQWLTDDDELFMDNNGRRVRASGPLTEMKSLVSLLQRVLTVPLETKGFGSSHLTPEFLLTRGSVEQTLIVAPLDQPVWHKKITGTTVSGVTETAVSFKTQLYGLLTISREHGLLVSQSLIGEEVEERLLTLTKLELNPTADRISDLSRDWSTLGATPIPVGAITASSRHNVFQTIIEAVERGVADLGKLENQLEEERDLLRRLASSAVTENSPLADFDWKTILTTARETLRDHWLETVPGAEADDVMALEAYLGSAEIRQLARDSIMVEIIPMLQSNRDTVAKVMPDFFGPNPAHLLVEEGISAKAARSVIETAIARACFEAHIDRKLAAAWSERDGLD